MLCIVVVVGGAATGPVTAVVAPTAVAAAALDTAAAVAVAVATAAAAAAATRFVRRRYVVEPLMFVVGTIYLPSTKNGFGLASIEPGTRSDILRRCKEALTVVCNG